METNVGQAGKQPNLSKTDAELNQLYPQLATASISPVIVAAIGTPYVTKTGATQVPILVVQKRNDTGNQSSETATSSAFEGEFFRGWGGRILRKFINATPEMLRAQNIKEGSVLPATINLEMHRDVNGPRYAKHDCVRYGANGLKPGEPRTANGGQLVYETIMLVNHEPNHVGVDGISLSYDDQVPVTVGRVAQPASVS